LLRLVNVRTECIWSVLSQHTENAKSNRSPSAVDEEAKEARQKRERRINILDYLGLDEACRRRQLVG
jgi:hypothetical protein